jgi:hypothetical protein
MTTDIMQIELHKLTVENFKTFIIEGLKIKINRSFLISLIFTASFIFSPVSGSAPERQQQSSKPDTKSERKLPNVAPNLPKYAPVKNPAVRRRAKKRRTIYSCFPRR